MPVPMQETPKPKPKKPNRIVNRGPAGVLYKPSKNGEQKDKPDSITIVQAKYQIVPALKHLASPIDKWTPDPNNARSHGERNMEAIRQSLRTYGQTKAIVVQASTGIVVAGNGTLQAAKDLGWKEIAATVVDMTDVEAAGFGLADNRSAELASWNLEVVAKIDKMLHAAGHPSIGWMDHELEVIRAADFNPAEINDEVFGSGGEGGSDDSQPLIISFTPDQYVIIGQVIERIKLAVGDPEMDRGAALAKACQEWLGVSQPEGVSDAGDRTGEEDGAEGTDG